MATTKEQVLERIAEMTVEANGQFSATSWNLDPEKLAALLAEMLSRIERLEGEHKSE